MNLENAYNWTRNYQNKGRILGVECKGYSIYARQDGWFVKIVLKRGILINAINRLSCLNGLGQIVESNSLHHGLNLVRQLMKTRKHWKTDSPYYETPQKFMRFDGLGLDAQWRHKHELLKSLTLGWNGYQLLPGS